MSILAITVGESPQSGSQGTFFNYYLKNNMDVLKKFSQKEKISKLIQALTGYDANLEETPIVKNSAELKLLF